MFRKLIKRYPTAAPHVIWVFFMVIALLLAFSTAARWAWRCFCDDLKDEILTGHRDFWREVDQIRKMQG